MAGTWFESADFGLLALRLFFVGMIFHGLAKLTSVAGTAGFFAHLGIPLPGVFAYLEPLVEVFGSFAIILGIETFYSGLLIAFSMLVALLLAVIPMVASKGPVFSISGLGTVLGLEFGYVVCGVAIALAGPGRYNLRKRFLPWGQAKRQR